MQLCVLGAVEAAIDGQGVSFTSRRQRTVLAALLAARGEVVSTDRLIDGLWDGQPPQSAHKTLQSHVSKLRRTLASLGFGDDVVVTTATGYRIDLTACDLDAIRFEHAVAEARDLAPTDPRAAVELLQDAEEPWRGPAYGDLASHDLVQADARHLEHLRASGAADRIDLQLELGDHRVVLGELDVAVSHDPLDERSHGQLMLALYLAGQQAEALDVHQRLRDRLRDELGIDPSADIQRLHERILRQDVQPATPANAPTHAQPRVQAHAAGQTTPRHLAGDTHLIGRDDDVSAVTNLVSENPLVTLIGAGGVGKTRLAEQVAASAGSVFPDGVVLCPLASIHEPATVASALIDALGAHHRGGRPPEEPLVASLGTRRVLLVLDNCEHLLEGVASVVETILSACPNVTVLATSREPLRTAGERVWQVAPLAIPPEQASATQVLAAPAGALFVTRAQATDPTFTLTADNAAAVGDLCRRLDGIPLAIELAAARVRALSPRDLLDRIGQRFTLLTGGPHREEGRHRTLQAVVTWSYDALDGPTARLFDRLSVFAGPFTLDAAEDVCAGPPVATDELAGLLADLVDKSMVVVDRRDEHTRYRLLDTLRHFGAARLAETGEEDRYRHAHAAHHVAFAEGHSPQVRGEGERDAVARIDRAIDDLRLAHGWLVATGDVDGALRLPVALRDYIGHRQRDEMTTWTQRAVAMPGASDHPAYPAALATAAWGTTRRGDLDRARQYATAALERADPAGHAASWATQALASIALYEGRLDDVVTLTEQRVPLIEGAGADYYRAMLTMQRVLALLYRGDTALAMTAADELRAAADASGNDAMRAWAQYCQGEARLQRDPARATQHLEGAIEAARRAEAAVPHGVAMVSLASLCGRTGEEDRAIRLFSEVIVHWRRLGDWTHQLTTLRNLVELLVHVDANEPAAVLHAAVVDASPPTFGEEADRLATAGAELERRLGPDRLAAATTRGQLLQPGQMIDHALDALEGLRTS
jgi:predicted ATPase/DNA-binding SARP family transcriptional activator